jgi:DNA-binding transcriptional LysR family regulator
MDLRQLRYFVAAAEEKSFLLAAKRVHVSQPALSLRLKELELNLKTSLFRRHPRGVELTEAGETLLPHAREVLAAIARADKSVRTAKTADEPVRLWAGPTPCLTLLPQLIEECGKLQPPFKLLVYERSVRGPNLLAEEGLGAVLSYAVQPSADVQIFPLYHEDLYLVGIPETFIDIHGHDVAFADLSRFRLVLYPKVMAIRQKIEDIAFHYEMKLNVVADVEPINATKAMMLEAGCCAIVPYPLYLREIREGVLMARRICAPQLTMTLKLALHASLPTAVADSLLAAVRTVVSHNIEMRRFNWRAIDIDHSTGHAGKISQLMETIATTM